MWGRFWNTGSKGASELILVSETFAAYQAGADLVSGSAYGGHNGGTRGKPAARFGAGPEAPIYLVNLASLTRSKSILNYSLHRRPKDGGRIEDARGRVNIGFADGHVTLKAHDELADFPANKSKFEALWSPKDRSVQ